PRRSHGVLVRAKDFHVSLGPLIAGMGVRIGVQTVHLVEGDDATITYYEQGTTTTYKGSG
ncbi:hypothetical protein ACFL2Q_09080, partial [Thermodesulfobacteriota bacterium]